MTRIHNIYGGNCWITAVEIYMWSLLVMVAVKKCIYYGYFSGFFERKTAQYKNTLALHACKLSRTHAHTHLYTHIHTHTNLQKSMMCLNLSVSLPHKERDSVKFECHENKNQSLPVIPLVNSPKISPQNQLDIYFLRVWENWLGLAKPKNVFRSILNPSTKYLWNFKNFVFTRFFYWLTYLLTNAFKQA